MSKKRNRDDFGPRVHNTGYVRSKQSRNCYLGDSDTVFPAGQPKFDRHYHNEAHRADELKYRKMFIYYHYVYILGGKAPENWAEQGTIALVLTAFGLDALLSTLNKLIKFCTCATNALQLVRTLMITVMCIIEGIPLGLILARRKEIFLSEHLRKVLCNQLTY